MYLEAHRPLLLVSLSCFGCLPPAPSCAYDILCTSQNFHIKSQSWDVNLACNLLSLGKYSSCHIQVLQYIIQGCSNTAMKGPQITMQKDNRILLLSSITDLCPLLNLKGCFASQSHSESQKLTSLCILPFPQEFSSFTSGGGFLSSWPADHQSMRTEAEAMTETALWETASANLFNFIPEQREYIGLGVVAGESPNLHQTAHSYQKAPSTSRSYLWKHGPITMFLVYV